MCAPVVLQVLVSSFEETLPHDAFPNAADYAIETARHKALDVAKLASTLPGPPVDLIISADTVSEM
jgi:septum formation protein